MLASAFRAAIAPMLLGLIVPNACNASATPQPELFEVDLIFPPNGSTFSAAGLPPLVFAVQNPALGWTLQAIVGWSLTRTNASTFVELQSQSYPVQYHNSISDNAPWLLFSSLHSLHGLEGEWTLEWGIDVQNQTCIKQGSPFQINENRYTTFTTGNQYPLPDLVSLATSGNCSQAQTLASFETEGYDDDGCTTQFLSPSNPSPCAVEFNSTMASSVAAAIKSDFCNNAMLNHTRFNCSSPKAVNATTSEAPALLPSSPMQWMIVPMALFMGAAFLL